jgi:hypothetical protein
LSQNRGQVQGKINDALPSYTNNYLEQKAEIDARLGNIEKLVEEQAQLTRTVESIKDEIAAQAKSRDNRWEFQKDLYVNLIKGAVDLMQAFMEFKTQLHTIPLTPKQQNEWLHTINQKVHSFLSYTYLAPLAIANEVLPLLASDAKFLQPFTNNESDNQAILNDKLGALAHIIATLQAIGHKDLWGMSEAKASQKPTQQR